MLVATGVLLAAMLPEGLLAQEIRARVVDEQSRSAVLAVVATLLTPDSVEITRATSDAEGFFQLTAPAPGPYLVRVERMGYAPEIRPVSLEEGQKVIPAFVLRTEAIPLDTLQVEFTPREITRPGVAGPTRPAYLLAGERMARLEHTGVSFFSAAQELGGGVRLKGVMLGERRLTCIESRRRSTSIRDNPRSCYNVAIVIDGVATGMDGVEALLFFQSLRVSDWESMEYLSPVDAGTQYGMLAGSRGALVLWSRGMGPHRSPARGGGR
jgi:hypothetical protein